MALPGWRVTALATGASTLVSTIVAVRERKRSTRILTEPGAPVTKAEVLEVQKKWSNAIATCSKIYKDGGDYIQAAADAAGELYAYGHSDVMFKPTKAKAYPFRPTAAEAMSYFVGGKVVDNGYDEDGGFAINGGRGWKSCVYDNHNIVCKGDTAQAMGEYVFTDATDGSTAKVEYTFGYMRCGDGKVRIYLHHSSVPYSAAPKPVTKAEVLEVQKNWAGAIASISKVHKDGGDYIQAAADAAGELYAYGHGDVMFKPTKAKAYPFRPTAAEAMSYFVGGKVVDNGYDEDGGFAINGGRGWKSCVSSPPSPQLDQTHPTAAGASELTRLVHLIHLIHLSHPFRLSHLSHLSHPSHPSHPSHLFHPSHPSHLIHLLYLFHLIHLSHLPHLSRDPLAPMVAENSLVITPDYS